jgi:hypothetical protein
VAQQHLPGSGWRLFDIRNEFPDAWQLFYRAIHQKHHENADHHEPHHRDFRLQFSRNMFPFLTGNREINIISLELFVETPCAKVGEHIKVKYYMPGSQFKDDEEECCRDDIKQFDCIVAREWPGLYHGVLQVKLGPITGSGNTNFGILRFPQDLSDIVEAYTLCRYEVSHKDPCERPAHLRLHRKVWGHDQWMEQE